MKGDREKEEPKQVLSESIATIQKVEDVSLQQDLLAAMAIMAGGRYAPELIRTMIRREMVMESPIYQEWVKEERTEAEARGEARGIGKGKADAICKILNKRLGLDSLKLQQQVRTITSEPVLDWIFDEIVDITSKEAAKNIIETAIKQSRQ
jgi:predicted transposase YdaD